MATWLSLPNNINTEIEEYALYVNVKLLAFTNVIKRKKITKKTKLNVKAKYLRFLLAYTEDSDNQKRLCLV